MGGAPTALSVQAGILKLLLRPADNSRLASLCGPLDVHLRQLEARFGIEVRHRGHDFQLLGEEAAMTGAADTLRALYRQTEHADLSEDSVSRFLLTTSENGEGSESGKAEELVLRNSRLRAYGEGQKRYLTALRDHDLVFGVGPAGTGKTHLAIAQAIYALEQDLAQKIVLVRPVLESGERLGFLPGDLAQKIDPYLRPMYDALDELMGHGRAMRKMESNLIEIAPLAYMRGRTLKHAFVILDEAQNASRGQMKMFLTRLGFGSRAVITGDLTQSDLPANGPSGLEEALNLLGDLPGIARVRFTERDIVRHPLVRQVIKAYSRGT